MTATVALLADDVRARLFAALEPIRLECERALTPVCRPELLRYVVQLHPLVVQVITAPDEGRPARGVVAFGAAALPDHGVALAVAATEMAAGLLASLSADAEVAVLASAALVEDGGLYVMADFSDETAVLALSGPGGDLGRGTVLGALTDRPETVH